MRRGVIGGLGPIGGGQAAATAYSNSERCRSRHRYRTQLPGIEEFASLCRRYRINGVSAGLIRHRNKRLQLRH